MTDCDYFFKTAKPTAVGVSLKSPALRGFVGGRTHKRLRPFILCFYRTGK